MSKKGVKMMFVNFFTFVGKLHLISRYYNFHPSHLLRNKHDPPDLLALTSRGNRRYKILHTGAEIGKKFPPSYFQRSLMLYLSRVVCPIRAVMITVKEAANTPQPKTAVVRVIKKTEPSHELLLAQLVLSAIIIGLLSHATYERFLHIPVYVLELHEEAPVFRPGRIKEVYINEFRVPHPILFQLTVSSGYFFVNLLLYITNKIMKEPILNSTIMILMQDVTFCVLMFTCSIAAVAHQGGMSSGIKDIEILIASGISMFCCVSSGVGVYYSYRVYKGL